MRSLTQPNSVMRGHNRYGLQRNPYVGPHRVINRLTPDHEGGALHGVCAGVKRVDGHELDESGPGQVRSGGDREPEN